ncbi:MAG: GatB/YqeY domain-containing protein [Deltaproteobacteria bacterium]|nr:GatB/YqeY domain-containing protein [Deltaproteobacteria bacterium]
MSLKERIEADFKQAVRQQETAKVSILRLVKAAIKNKEIENRGSLDDAQILKVFSTMTKQTRDSIEQFQKGNRADLVQKEKTELAILEGYMPRSLSEAELEVLVRKAVQDTGAVGPKDMGKVMQAVMPQVQGRAEGKQVQEKVKKALN